MAQHRGPVGRPVVQPCCRGWGDHTISTIQPYNTARSHNAATPSPNPCKCISNALVTYAFPGWLPCRRPTLGCLGATVRGGFRSRALEASYQSYALRSFARPSSVFLIISNLSFCAVAGRILASGRAVELPSALVWNAGYSCVALVMLLRPEWMMRPRVAGLLWALCAHSRTLCKVRRGMRHAAPSGTAARLVHGRARSRGEQVVGPGADSRQAGRHSRCRSSPSCPPTQVAPSCGSVKDHHCPAFPL